MASPSRSTRRTSSAGGPPRKRKADSGEDNTSYHGYRSSEEYVGDDNSPGPSNAPIASKRARTYPPPSAIRDIPCLPCIGRGVKTPGHLCSDYDQVPSHACWHCKFVNKRTERCIPIPDDIRDDLMAFWAVNSTLPHDHVRDRDQEENTEHIKGLIAWTYQKAKRERAVRAAIRGHQVPQPMAARHNLEANTDNHGTDIADGAGAGLAAALQEQTTVIKQQTELLGNSLGGVIREQTESLGERLEAVIEQRLELTEESLAIRNQEQIAAIQQQTVVLEDRLSHQTRVMEKTLATQTQVIEKMAASVERMATSVEEMSVKMTEKSEQARERREVRVDACPGPENAAMSVGSYDILGEDGEIDKDRWRKDYFAHWGM